MLWDLERQALDERPPRASPLVAFFGAEEVPVHNLNAQLACEIPAYL